MANQTGNTSVKERVIADIEEVLKRIKMSNGYDNNIESVQRWEQHGNDKAVLPFILIYTGSEQKEYMPSLVTRCKLSVVLELGFVHDKTKYPGSTDQLMTSFANDIEKAVMADYQRSGLADNTVVSTVDPFPVSEGQSYSQALVTLEVVYKHLTGDPKTNF